MENARPYLLFLKQDFFEQFQMDRYLGSVLIFIAKYLLQQASSALALKLAKSNLFKMWGLKNLKDFLTFL